MVYYWYNWFDTGRGTMNRSHTISVRIPPELFEEIKEIAHLEHRSISQQINLYLEAKIKERKNENSSAEPGGVTSEVIS